jgi:hypothetical protein
VRCIADPIRGDRWPSGIKAGETLRRQYAAAVFFPMCCDAERENTSMRPVGLRGDGVELAEAVRGAAQEIQQGAEVLL